MPEPQWRNNIINLIGKTEELCGWRKASEVEWYERSEHKTHLKGDQDIEAYGASLVFIFFKCNKKPNSKINESFIYWVHWQILLENLRQIWGRNLELNAWILGSFLMLTTEIHSQWPILGILM